MAALYPQFVEVDRARLATWTAWDDACTKAGKRRDMWATDQGYSLPEYAAYDQAFELAGLLQVQLNTLGQRALELPPTTLEGLAAYAVAVRHMGIDKGEHAKDYPDLDFQAARIADFTRIVREVVRHNWQGVGPMRNPRTSNTAKAKRSRAPRPHPSDERTFIVNPRRAAAASNGGQRI